VQVIIKYRTWHPSTSVVGAFNRETFNSFEISRGFKLTVSEGFTLIAG
jgi:hypothetical protein